MGIKGIDTTGQPFHGAQGFRPPPTGFQNALQEAEKSAKTPDLRPPVNAPVSKPFSADHQGVDFAVPNGTPVCCAGDGVVESAGWAGSYGNLLVVRHDAKQRAYYAHLSGFNVHPGQQVVSGQQIADSGNTGQAANPHLHFELRIEGTPVDPAGSW